MTSSRSRHDPNSHVRVGYQACSCGIPDEVFNCKIEVTATATAKTLTCIGSSPKSSSVINPLLFLLRPLRRVCMREWGSGDQTSTQYTTSKPLRARPQILQCLAGYVSTTNKPSISHAAMHSSRSFDLEPLINANINDLNFIGRHCPSNQR
jgi:hypothetical protein